MPASIADFFSSAAFMPHGHCYLWEPTIVWLQVISNALIGLAYLAISLGLAWLVKKGNYVPFKGMAVAFGVFIVTCGITHFSDVYVIYRPAYWVDSAIRVITAIASVGTALLLPPLIPRAVAIAQGAKAAREHGIELQAAVQDLGRMYEKSKQLDQLKTQFFANVSHELRTPLQLIMGPAEKLLSADNLTPEQRRDAQLVVRNARMLLGHVNDLLDVAKLESGKLEPEFVRLELSSQVRLVAANFDGIAADRQMDFAVETPEEVIAEVDREKIQRVLLNLLSNAFKFTPAGGRIRCTLARIDDTRVLLEVADSGPGIPLEQREIVFDRFRQGDASSTRKFGGTGLGLSIVKDFVDLHGGTVELREAPEGGASFEIILPLQAPVGAEVHADAGSPGAQDDMARRALDDLEARVEALSPTASDTRPCVLVVEDNPDMNRFVAETLASDFHVERAFNGNEALTKAMEMHVDLIVSDIMMPECSGDQLVERLRENPEFDNVPIMLLTAKADDELRIKLLSEGAQDYVMKPFAAQELKARARNLVTMKRARDVLQRELSTQVRDLEVLAEEVTRRKRDLDTALESMRVAREHAERASQLKTDFLRTVSHELRSPLASLQLQLERLRIASGDLPEDKRPLVGRMTASTGRLHDLIESLLQYARIQSGRLHTDTLAVDLHQLPRQVIDDLRPQAEDKQLALELDLSAAATSIETDPRLLYLVLVNLVGNAIKFTTQGRVMLAVKSDEHHHRLCVTDTGPGIPANERVRIFEPFEQLEPTRAKHMHGIGLGLALVREMVGSLGGSIEVDSQVGTGSTFTVVLPVHPKPVVKSENV